MSLTRFTQDELFEIGTSRAGFTERALSQDLYDTRAELARVSVMLRNIAAHLAEARKNEDAAVMVEDIERIIGVTR